MAPLWHNTLWSTRSVLHTNVYFRGAGNGARVREEFWVDEHHRSLDTILVSLLPPLVRKHVRTCPCQLLDTWLARWIETH